ncbi:MAG TPA: family 20 glycosylhydrolase, partial [Chitinophagaceae bacterium]|nr:family 20 glycosylhydrolase [Chitinophagaceae bacterium]
NFFSVETVKQYIDLMAAYKLNQLHWHLTDDQGWRIEIKKYPKLTTVGSRRDRTVLGHYWDRLPQWFDTADHAGFYTQAQIRDIVRYAAERHINIIPEIEMPGHSSAAIAAYPELSCVPGEPKKVAETWGIFTDIYCPSETTFRFLEDVLAEVMELFPSPYIHIGGDEAPKDKWEASPLAQALIRERGLKDAHGLQSYFISRIEQFVNSKGRKLIGWDEILEGGLAPNAAVTSWRGEQGGIDAARLGHEVVMNSQLNGLYFSDRPEPRTELEFRMNRHSLQALYQYDPVPSVLTPEQRKYIIGAQGAIWTEYVRTPARLQYTLLPRMLALSELLWTPAAGRNFHTFAAERLPLALARLEKGGIQFRVPPALGPVDTLLQGGQFLLTFAPSVAGAVIHYTTDGYPATETDRVYTAPLVITVPEGEQREIQTVVVTPGNRKSAVTRTVLYNRPAPEATRYGVLNGLNYRLSRGSFSALSELDTARVWTSDTATSWDMEALRRQHGRFGITYSGFIRLDTDGAYTFSLQSDGPSELLVDGRVVAVHTGGGAAPSTGTVTTLRGLHALRIRYRNTGQPNQLQITLRLPDGRSLPLPHWMLLGQNIGAGMTGVDYQ